MQKNLKRLSSDKILFSIFVILLGSSCTWAQQKETELNIPVPNPFRDYKKLPMPFYVETEELPDRKIGNAQNAAAIERKQEKSLSALVEIGIKTDAKERGADEADIKGFSYGETLSQIKDKEKFHWKPALIQSGIFLGIQHGFRITQKKTRQELGGPFFPDWARSVKRLRGWKDADSFFTNYVAHPLQGGLTGRVFVINSDRAKNQEFGKSNKYCEQIKNGSRVAKLN